MNKENSKTEVYEDLINRVANAILKSNRIVALTGAGISVASGIPPFRGKGGLWSKYDPDEYAHILAFKRNPEKVWIMLKEMIDTILPAKPNAAHIALMELEVMGHLEGIITGNVDSLHQAAGSKNVVELHGNNRNLICMDCGNIYDIKIYHKKVPPKCECGNPLRPDVVFFGEQIPPEALIKSFELAENCDMMMVIGTSAIVSPMSNMPIAAKEHGANVIEINTEKNNMSGFIPDWTIKGKAEKILPKIISNLKNP